MSEGPAYVHPSPLAPEGIWFKRTMVEPLLKRDVIAVCDDCTERYPEDPSYAIVGGEGNLAIVRQYEVVYRDDI